MMRHPVHSHGITRWVDDQPRPRAAAPDIKERERQALSLGARLRVTGEVGRFASVPGGYVPLRHLSRC